MTQRRNRRYDSITQLFMSDTKAEASRRDQSAIAVDGLNDHNVLNNVNDAKTSICICTDVPQIFYALSTLVVAELDYGAKVSQRSEENLEKLYRFLNIVQIVPFDVECANVFGTVKS